MLNRLNLFSVPIVGDNLVPDSVPKKPELPQHQDFRSHQCHSQDSWRIVACCVHFCISLDLPCFFGIILCFNGSILVLSPFTHILYFCSNSFRSLCLPYTQFPLYRSSILLRCFLSSTILFLYHSYFFFCFLFISILSSTTKRCSAYQVLCLGDIFCQYEQENIVYHLGNIVSIMLSQVPGSMIICTIH